MAMRTRIRITNTSAQPIDIGGRWLQPGEHDVFDEDRVPPEWRAGGEVVDTRSVDAGQLQVVGDDLFVRQRDGRRAAVVEAVAGAASEAQMGVLQRALSNVIGWKPIGINVSVGLSAGRTYCMKLALPADFDAVQLIHFHHDSVATTVYSAAIAATETAAADTAAVRFKPIVNGGEQNALDNTSDIYGWRSVTWGGAQTITPAAAAAKEAPIVTASDWIDCASVPRADGGTLPLLLVRLNARGGVNSYYTTAAGADVENSVNRGLIAFGGSYADTTGAMVTAPGDNTPPGAYDYRLPPLGFRIRSRKLGLTIMGIGDSITQVTQTVPDKLSSWGFRAAAALTAAGLPCGWINSGVASFNQATYWAAAKPQLSIWRPSVAVFAGFSPNDGNFANAGDMRFKMMRAGSRVADFVETCVAAGISPIVANGLPCSASRIGAAATDVERVAYNARLAQIQARGVRVLDWDGLMSNGASPARIRSENQYDETHPNEAGVQMQARQLLDTVAAMFGLADA